MSLPIEKELNKGNTKIMEAPVKKRKRTVRYHITTKISPPFNNPTAKPSNSSSSPTTEQDKELVRSLLLLSRGIRNPNPAPKTEKSSEKSEKLAGKGGHESYECKTCFKTFPSFQALGGHRASHKKPKLLSESKKAGSIGGVAKSEDQMKKDEAQVAELTLKSPIIALNGNNSNNNNGCNSKVRVHECSICQAEFSSGQALGGHMRRHRPLNTGPVEPPEAKKERKFLGFDLNMPAQEELFESQPSVYPLEADLPTDLALGLK